MEHALPRALAVVGDEAKVVEPFLLGYGRGGDHQVAESGRVLGRGGAEAGESVALRSRGWSRVAVEVDERSPHPWREEEAARRGTRERGEGGGTGGGERAGAVLWDDTQSTCLGMMSTCVGATGLMSRKAKHTCRHGRRAAA
jgi:hypothetical protein